MDERARLAAASRDSVLALRRVERQQFLIERLAAAHGERLTVAALAHELRVSARTLARDLERLATSGVPIRTTPGRGGGVSLPAIRSLDPVTLDLSEAAALLASLAVLGPTVSLSAGSAMRKLAEALADAAETGP